MDWARFWGVFFFLILLSFIIRIVLRKKRIEKGRIDLMTKLIIAALPYFLVKMWYNRTIPIDAKIFDALIGICCVGVGILFLFLGKKYQKEITQQR